MDNPNPPGSCDNDQVGGASPLLTDPQTDHSAEFTRLLNAVHAAVAVARSRGRLTFAEKRAVLALLEAVAPLVAEHDAP